LAFVLVGNARHWLWVNALLFRVAHLVAVGVIVVQAWLGALVATQIPPPMATSNSPTLTVLR